jgi:hypothetical protein
MNRKRFTLVLLGFLFCLTGCSHEGAISRYSESLDKAATASRSFSRLTAYAALEPSMARSIAESHTLEIITSESELPKAWESAVGYCGKVQCEVLNSNITTRSGDAAPSGSISLRVAPEDLVKLLAQVEKLGKVAQHSTQRQDKTVDVTDTDARIKNLTTFRDNLRAMLAKPSATVKDLIEIQQQLMETQSELDSETAKRKNLANLTEKIAVELSFRVEQSSAPSRGFAKIRRALRESGSTLAESTAYLLDFIFSVIPWLILILPAVWLLGKAWRKIRPKRGVAAAPTQSSVQ